MNKLDISNKYAIAFVNTLESGKELEILNKFKDVIELFESKPEILKILNSRKIEATSKQDLLKQEILSGFDIKIIEFINILIKENKLYLLKYICNFCENIIYNKNNIMEMQVYSAFEINKDKLSELQDLYEKKYNANKIIIKSFVDKKLIGGLKIKINGVVEDATIVNRLNNIKILLENDI